MARVRAAPGSQAQPKSNATRQALKEKTNTTNSTVPVYENDGDADGLVKDAKPKRGRPRKVARQESDELVMAGGLGMTSEERSKQSSDVPTTTDELAKSDSAPIPVARGNFRPPRTVRKIVTSKAQSDVLEGLKQRMGAAAQSQRTKQLPKVHIAQDSIDQPDTTQMLPAKPEVTHQSGDTNLRRSELSLSSSPPAPQKISPVRRHRSSLAQPGSVLKAHNTPAVESSMLALKNFKRRPRQPSMLQMVRQKVGSARPSLTNATTITANEDAVDDTTGFDLDLSNNNEDDFAPEAEGTPLHLNKKQSSLLSRAESRSKGRTSPATALTNNAQNKRKSDTRDPLSGSTNDGARKKQRHQEDVSSGSLSALRAQRNRPSLEVEQAYDAIDDDDNIVVRSSAERGERPQPAATSDIQVINSQSSSTPPTEHSSPQQDASSGKDDVYAVPSTERETEVVAEAQRGVDQDVNETLADPESSPGPVSQDLMADPATQRASPSPVKRKSRGKPKPINTAALQNLLPKRRKPLQPSKRVSDYDLESSDVDVDAGVDSSHLEDDEDELGARGRPRTKHAPVKSSKSGATAPRGRPRKSATAAAKKSSSKKTAKTYGRNAASDKENEGYEPFEEAEESTWPDISHSMQEIAKSKELEAAKAKFADIDQWDMEFESMSADDHRSSSLNWR